jgi:curved DNA-binding protein CbpA
MASMSNEPADYYTVLGVADTATQQEISRAFRGLMRTRHPDVDAAAAAPTSAEVLAIMNAFGVLRDPRKRAEYDRRQNRNARAEHPIRTTAQDIPVRYGPREAPVRRIPKPSPILRVTPVRWEEGPWAGPRPVNE